MNAFTKQANLNDAARGDSIMRTQASILTDAIRKDIIAGILAPGSKLPLRELSARYNVGTNPLREALSRLAMSGFVKVVDQRGFRVANTSNEELLDIARVRSLIEVEALRDAIAHGNLDWEAKVMGAFHRLGRIPISNPLIPGTLNPEWEDAHDAYHRALLSACTSPWLLNLILSLREHSARYRHLSVRSNESGIRDIREEHRLLNEATLSRQAPLACRLLAEHLMTAARLATQSGGPQDFGVPQATPGGGPGRGRTSPGTPP